MSIATSVRRAFALMTVVGCAACHGCRSTPATDGAPSSPTAPTGSSVQAPATFRLYAVSNLAGALEPC